MSKPDYDRLPQELRANLRSLDRWVRGLAAVRGVGMLAVVSSGALAVALVVDWIVEVGMTARVGLLLAVLLAVLATLFLAVIWPVVRRFSASELAALVDSTFPEMGERLESAVELTDPTIPARHRGSPMMRARLLSETVRCSEVVDYREAADSSAAFRWTWMGLVTVVLLLAPFGLSSEGYGLLLTRFFTPWENLERATNLYFVIESGDRAVARGADVTITAVPRWRFVELSPPESVWLHWTIAGGNTETRRMEFDPERGAFHATLPHVVTSFDYDVSAGRARTRTYHIDVVEPPSLAGFTLHVAPPAYTGRPARRIDGPVGRIEVFENSRLTFQLSFAGSVTAATLEWLDPVSAERGTEDDDGIPVPLSTDGRTGTLQMTAERGGPFRIVLRDQRNVESTDDELRELALITDQPPVIEWADAQIDLEQATAVRADEGIPLSAIATDDLGVAEIELHAEIVQRSESLEPLIADIPTLGQPRVQHTMVLDLTSYGLQEGDLISVRARALDARPIPGPQEGWTPSRLIRISSEAESFDKLQLTQKQQQLRAILEAARQTVQKDKEATESLREAARESIETDRPTAQQAERIAELEAEEQKLAQRLEQLAAAFAEHPLQRTIAEDTRAVGDGPVEDARQHFQEAAAAEPQEQLEKLTGAANELARAETQLDELLRRFDELAALEQDLQRLQKLADDAERLAGDVANFEQQWDQLKASQDVDEQDRLAREQALTQGHQQLQDEQRKLSGALDQLLEERPEVIEAALQRQIERLQELSEEATRLGDQEDRLASALEQQTADAEEAAEADSTSSPAEPAATDAPPDENVSPSPEPDESTQPGESSVRRQQQLAEAAARFALETARARGAETKSAQQARQFAEQSLRAADDARTGLLPEAAASAQQAAEAAQQTARQLKDPTDPAPASLREEAEALAARQQELAEELRQQAESEPARRQAQTAGQQQLASDSSNLTERLQEIAERLRDAPLEEPERSDQATAAQHAAESATESMEDALEELAQRRPQEAAPAARGAAEALRNAAREAGQVPENSEPNEASPVPGEVGEQVTDARRQLQRAGDQLRRNGPAPSSTASAETSSEQTPPAPAEPSDAEQNAEASADNPSDGNSDSPEQPNSGDSAPAQQLADQNATESMKQVAESLRRAARQLGMSPSGESGKPSEQDGESAQGDPGSQSGTTGDHALSLSELEAELKGLSTRNWGQLPGKIEAELFQSTQKSPDGDYARLIRLYFEEISRRRSAADGLNSQDKDR